MSAETQRFQVAETWASLARWLSWAMDSVQARQFDDAAYNLSQFWGELEGWKASPLYPQEWGDLGRMDALSNLTLANLATAQIQEATDAAGRYGKLGLAMQALTIPLGVAGILGLDPSRITLQDYVKALQRRRRDAVETALDLGQRAANTLSSAGLDTSSAAVVMQAAMNLLGQLDDMTRREGWGVDTATPNWGTVAADVAVGASRAAGETMERFKKAAGDAMKDGFPNILGAVPWWAWAGIIGAVVLIPLLMPSPRINIAGRD